jgi:hypothetical protein
VLVPLALALAMARPGWGQQPAPVRSQPGQSLRGLVLR